MYAEFEVLQVWPLRRLIRQPYFLSKGTVEQKRQGYTYVGSEDLRQRCTMLAAVPRAPRSPVPFPFHYCYPDSVKAFPPLHYCSIPQ